MDSSAADLSGNATAVSGRCPQDCDMLYVMVPCLFVMMFPVFLSTTPTSMATLRYVYEKSIDAYAYILSIDKTHKCNVDEVERYLISGMETTLLRNLKM